MSKTKLSETIIGKMTVNALINWNGLTKEEANVKVDAMPSWQTATNEVTYGSEMAAIENIGRELGLNEDEVSALIEDVYENKTVRPEIAEVIQLEANASPIDNTAEWFTYKILSEIHDNWVKDNGNKFEARPKNYQFAPLQLLPYYEAEADLIFVEPILNACGITIDRDALRTVHNTCQSNVMSDIKTHEDLVKKLASGSEFYPALDGVKTNKGVKGGETYSIESLLAENPSLAEGMAGQLEDKSEKIATALGRIKK